MFKTPPPRADATVMFKRMLGMASSTSMQRMMTLSTVPP